MSREHAAIKWLIGIIAFVVWVAVGRGLIFGGDATYSSVGQQWAFGIWTIAVIVGAVNVAWDQAPKSVLKTLYYPDILCSYRLSDKNENPMRKILKLTLLRFKKA